MKFFIELTAGTYAKVYIEDIYMSNITSDLKENIPITIVGFAYSSNLEKNLRELQPPTMSRLRGQVIGIEDLNEENYIHGYLEKYSDTEWRLRYLEPINGCDYSPVFLKEFLLIIVDIYVNNVGNEKPIEFPR